MELSTERPVDFDAFEAICCLPDDLYRLRWVSYAYHDIDKRFAENLGRTHRGQGSRGGLRTPSAKRCERTAPTRGSNKFFASMRCRKVSPRRSYTIQKRLRGLNNGALPPSSRSGIVSCSTRSAGR